MSSSCRARSSAAPSFFSHINFDLLQRPNVQLRVDDGRNYLLTTRKQLRRRSRPTSSCRAMRARARLYSREYFQLVRDALAPGGLVLQWNGGEGDTTYRLILRTFLVGVSSYDAVGGRHVDGRQRQAVRASAARLTRHAIRTRASASCSTGTSTRSSGPISPARTRSTRGSATGRSSPTTSRRSSTSCRCRGTSRRPRL